MFKTMMNCCYCHGNGSIKVIGMLSGEQHYIGCTDCKGQGKVCSLCWKTEDECECPREYIKPRIKKEY